MNIQSNIDDVCELSVKKNAIKSRLRILANKLLAEENIEVLESGLKAFEKIKFSDDFKVLSLSILPKTLGKFLRMLFTPSDFPSIHLFKQFETLTLNRGINIQ